MNDLKSMLKMMHRPRILMRAARHGLCDYNRTRDLKRLLRIETTPSSGQAVMALINEELKLENLRKSREANYCVMRHIEILIALLGEARLFTEETTVKNPPQLRIVR